MIWFDGGGLATGKPDATRVWTAKVIPICVPTTAARVNDWLLLSSSLLALLLLHLCSYHCWLKVGKYWLKSGLD